MQETKEMQFDPWVRKSPWRIHGNPLQYSCLENPHGQRNLVGYTVHGVAESDTTEQLSTHRNIKKVTVT